MFEELRFLKCPWLNPVLYMSASAERPFTNTHHRDKYAMISSMHEWILLNVKYAASEANQDA